MPRRQRRGMVTVEAVITLMFLVGAFVALGIYFQRGAQGYVKSNADSWGTQFQSDTGWSTTITSSTNEDKTDIVSTQKTDYKQTVN